MRFYLTEKSIPELQDLPPNEKKAVERAFARRPFFWLVTFGATACALAFVEVFDPFDPNQPAKKNIPTWLVLPVSTVIWLSWAQLVFGRLRFCTRNYLRAPRLLLGEPEVQTMLCLSKKTAVRLFTLNAAWANALALLARRGQGHGHDVLQRVTELLEDYEGRSIKHLSESQSLQFANWRESERGAVDCICRRGGTCFQSFELDEYLEPERPLQDTLGALVRQLPDRDLPFAVKAVVLPATDDAAMAPLVHLITLKSLTLVGAAVTDAVLRHLPKLPNLRRLHLEQTAATDGGVADVQRMLPYCRITP